jgi:hypothetical protein
MLCGVTNTAGSATKLFVTRYVAVDLRYLNILRQTTLRNQPFVFKK